MLQCTVKETRVLSPEEERTFLGTLGNDKYTAIHRGTSIYVFHTAHQLESFLEHLRPLYGVQLHHVEIHVFNTIDALSTFVKDEIHHEVDYEFIGHDGVSTTVRRAMVRPWLNDHAGHDFFPLTIREIAAEVRADPNEELWRAFLEGLRNARRRLVI